MSFCRVFFALGLIFASCPFLNRLKDFQIAFLLFDFSYSLLGLIGGLFQDHFYDMDGLADLIINTVMSSWVHLPKYRFITVLSILLFTMNALGPERRRRRFYIEMFDIKQFCFS